MDTDLNTLILLLVAAIWLLALGFLLLFMRGADARRLGEQDPEEAEVLVHLHTPKKVEG